MSDEHRRGGLESGRGSRDGNGDGGEERGRRGGMRRLYMTQLNSSTLSYWPSSQRGREMQQVDNVFRRSCPGWVENAAKSCGLFSPFSSRRIFSGLPPFYNTSGPHGISSALI